MRRYLVIAIAMVMVSAMITYSILIWDKPVPEAKDLPGKPIDPLSGIALDPVNPLNIKVSQKPQGVDRLTLRRLYTFCGHTVEEELTQNSPVIGLPREEVLKLYSDWEIKEDSGNRLVLFHRMDDLCPADLLKRYVGEKGGFVTIFYGMPGMKEKVFRMTKMSVKSLPLQIQANLERGILCESEDHLVSIIEGLEVYFGE